MPPKFAALGPCENAPPLAKGRKRVGQCAGLLPFRRAVACANEPLAPLWAGFPRAESPSRSSFEPEAARIGAPFQDSGPGPRERKEIRWSRRIHQVRGLFRRRDG